MEQVKNEDIIYKVGVYCRLSKDDEQAGESVSIETQKMLLTGYCHEQGFSIYEVYADDGYSGLNFNRPAFNRMLEDIDNDIAPFKNILNDMYAKDLSRKVKSAKRQRASKGYYISAQAPFGYKVDVNNRNRLVVDEEAAEVVKEIFRLAIAGYSLSKISRILTEKKVIKPGVYKALNGDTRFLRYQSDEASNYKWCYQTVRNILRDQVYTGDMVNHKYEVINYKTKECVRVPKEERIIVSNCHEPIVERDDYERVQTLITLRHRPKTHNFENVFKNLTFCSECRQRMTLMMKPLKAGPTPLIRCTNHYRNPNECRHNHAIYSDKLYDEVLTRVKRLACQVESGELLKQIRKASAKNVKADKLKAEQSKISKRLNILRKIIKNLYEDFDRDVLDSENYHLILSEYTQEQKKLLKKQKDIESELSSTGQEEQNVEKLRKVLEEYLNIETLTANMLNQLIERIEIGHAVMVNGCRQQEITIVYRFVGIIE